MRAILQGISGPGKGIQFALDSNIAISVGRNVTCTVSIPGDSALSGRHFEIIRSDQQLLLRDLGSTNGTFINEIRVRELVLQGGESIVAGQSVFHIQRGDAPMPTVLEALSSQPEPLYAVLDTARDPAIYPLILASGEQYMCLYSGKSAVDLEAVAPYLVSLPPGCELLQKIVAQGWGKSWGIFLTSTQAPQTIWHELRRSLMVKLETTQKLVYFRFYDPRVIRTFLMIATLEQRAALHGTIISFLMEDVDSGLLLCYDASRATSDLYPVQVQLD